MEKGYMPVNQARAGSRWCLLLTLGVALMVILLALSLKGNSIIWNLQGGWWLQRLFQLFWLCCT